MKSFKKRSPLFVVVMSLITFGLYLIYWYAQIYKEIRIATGTTPTGNSFRLDFLLSLFTFGVWGIFVDYKISTILHQIRSRHQLEGSNTSLIVVILDVFAYMTFFFLWVITSAIQQEEWNQISEKLNFELEKTTTTKTPTWNSPY
ncbi:MAG: DUF4234 domain-containing protein [Leptospiraceae bacterium]|nr:DUF4234 domain-containing protein [Leptospiraceae bacterium]MDW7975480.1 DUF4234 domain-containing protein [Leptospiraceae bacterium]